MKAQKKETEDECRGGGEGCIYPWPWSMDEGKRRGDMRGAQVKAHTVTVKRMSHFLCILYKIASS